MYKIVCVDGTVLYDQNDVNEDLVADPTCDMEIGQAGSLKFKLLPGHRLYNLVQTMETYMSAYDDDKEIFYGRIIDIQDNRVTGEREVTCAGALQFLEDVELAPFPKNSKGERTRNLTGAQFLVECIRAHHDGTFGDDRRLLDVGDIYHTNHNVAKDFTISSYTQVKSAIDSNLLGDYDYGGYLMIGQPHPRAPKVHMVHWVKSFTECNNSPIRLTLNVQEQKNATTANNFFTAIRPVGKDDLLLDEEYVTVSDAIVAKYGMIVKTVSFSDKENQTDLREAAENYIRWYGKGLGRTATVKVIDMNYLDGTIPKLFLGNAYTNIDGFEGETMVIASMHWAFADPSNNTVTLKNDRDLSSTQGGGGGGGGSTGTSSSSTATGFQNAFNHISETEKSLTLHADEIYIQAIKLEESAAEFRRYSTEQTTATNLLGKRITTIEGTEVIQNSHTISNVAGSYSLKYTRVPDSWLKNNTNPKESYYYEPHYYTIKQVDIDNDVWVGKTIYRSLVDAQNGINYMGVYSKGNIYSGAVGTTIVQMELTDDETVKIIDGAKKAYYYRNLNVVDGTVFSITQDGTETTVVNKILNVEENVETIEGSALWTQRDHITGVVGEYEIRTDPTTGERTLVIKSGGGMAIRRNGVEYGVYDNYNLTGGVIAGKVNNDSTAKIEFNSINSDVTDYTALGLYDDNTLTAGILVTKINTDETGVLIKGDKVDIEAKQVKIGSTSNVQAWMNSSDVWKNSTDETLEDYEGLIADRATIAQLNAQKARIDDVYANKLTATYINSLYDSAHTLTCHNFSATGSIDFTFNQDYGSTIKVGADQLLKKLKIVRNGNTYTLKYLLAGLSDDDGNYFDVGSFSRATSLSGTWSGATFTVTATPQGDTKATTISLDGGTGGVDDPDYTAKDFISHKAYINVKGTQTSGTETIKKILVDATNDYNAGRAYVTLNDPSWNAVTGTLPTSRTITVSTSGRTNASGTTANLSKSTTLYLTQGSWSTNSLTVSMRVGSTSGTAYAQTTVDASGRYNAGRAAVTLNDPTYNSVSSLGTSRTVEVTTSGRTNASGTTANLSKSVALFLTQGSWSSNKLTVTMRAGSTSGTALAETSVDASSRYNAGRAAVTLNDPSWNAVTGTLPTSRTITVSTSGRTKADGTTENLSKSVALFLTQGSWSSNKLTVTMRAGSTSGTAYAQTTVDASSRYNAGIAAYYNSSYWSNASSLSAGSTVYIPNSTNTGSEEWFTIPSGGSRPTHSAYVYYYSTESWSGMPNVHYRHWYYTVSSGEDGDPMGQDSGTVYWY